MSFALALLISFSGINASDLADSTTIPRYAVGIVRSDIKDADRVGRKTTGLICGPDGAITWREVRPEPAAATIVTARALRAAGMDVFVPADDLPDITVAAPIRILGSIVAAHIDACVPQHGLIGALGGRQTLKANGSITILWRIVEVETHTTLREFTLEQPVRVNRKAMSLSDVVLSAFAESAGQLSVSLHGTD